MIRSNKKLLSYIAIIVISAILALSSVFCFPQNVRAEGKELIEIKTNDTMKGEFFVDGYIYNIDVDENGYVKINSVTTAYKSDFIYVMMQASGGAGGNDALTSKRGYGGGSGAFAIYRLNLTEANATMAIGRGGSFDFIHDEFWYGEQGDGIFTALIAIAKGAYDSSNVQIKCDSGKHGTTEKPGQGGKVIQYTDNQDYLKHVYSKDGLEGGMPSMAFSISINEPGYNTYTEKFGFNISGFAWSGIGGAASPYGKGADGGVISRSGQNAQYFGAGGGGVGLGGNKSGEGGYSDVRFFVGNN